jgi:restriction endonuclease S subunit
MKFKRYKMSEVATIAMSNVDKKTKEGETPVKLCNFVDVYRNWAITKDLIPTLMSATAKPQEIEKFTLSKGQVALTKDSETRDDIGIATYIADNMDNVLLGYHCAVLTPNSALVDSKYLNAYMHSNIVHKYFENNASGSGQRYTLSYDAFLNIPVLLPDLELQKEIGQIFSNIDRKIALNRQINGHPIVQYIWGKNWVNNHAHILKPKSVGQLYYYYFVLKQIPVALIETGSIQRKISQQNLLSYKVAVPSENLIQAYSNVANVLQEQRKKNSDEIVSLTKQRDELLPLLMNGQVTVNYHLSLAHITPTTLAPLCTP